jgi:hypothetical protein
VIKSDVPPTPRDLNFDKMLYVCHQLKMYKEIVRNGGKAIDDEEELLVTMTNDECLILIQEFFVEP